MRHGRVTGVQTFAPPICRAGKAEAEATRPRTELHLDAGELGPEPGCLSLRLARAVAQLRDLVDRSEERCAGKECCSWSLPSSSSTVSLSGTSVLALFLLP